MGGHVNIAPTNNHHAYTHYAHIIQAYNSIRMHHYTQYKEFILCSLLHLNSACLTVLNGACLTPNKYTHITENSSLNSC